MNRIVAAGVAFALLSGVAVSSRAEEVADNPATGDLRPSVGETAGATSPTLPFKAVDAADAGELPATCLMPPAKFEQSVVDAFLAAPHDLLTRHPDAGMSMVLEVRGLSGSDARAVQAMIDLVPSANKVQKGAIGAGMARAAVACAELAPDYSAYIQEKIVAAADTDLLTAFAAASGDFETTAIAIAPGRVAVSYPSISGVSAPGGSTRGIGKDGGVVQTSGTYTFQRRRGIFGPIDDGSDVSKVTSVTIAD